MNTNMTATLSRRSNIVIITLLIACCELVLISQVLSAASIDQATSNTSQQSKHVQPERQSQQQASQRGHNQLIEGHPQHRPPKQLKVLQDFLTYSGPSAEENDPMFIVKCPLEDCIIRKPVASKYTESLINSKFKQVRDNIEVDWFKNDEPFLSRPNGNRIDRLDDGSLVLYQFGASDEGYYKCVINYSRVPVELSKYFEFNIGAQFDINMRDSLPDLPPTITHPPANIFAASGDNVTFTCNRTDTLSTQRTVWFKSCPFKNIICIAEFMDAFNRSVEVERSEPLKRFIYDGYDHDHLTIENVSDDRIGYYGCAVSNNMGIDIRLGRLDLIDNWAKSQMELKVQSARQSETIESIPWAWLAIGMGSVLFVSIALLGCGYILKKSIQRDKKQSAPLINTVMGKEPDPRARLPNIEAPDIYNTGKSIDGFITGHFHQATGHLMAQSICSNLLDKATPSISSANSHQSDEASSSWGKSSGDNFKAFYTPASNTTATTVPMYDHPPSTGTLGHCSNFVHGACINNPTYGFLRPENDATNWIFPRRNLDKLDKIGEGQFGEVWRYVARPRDGTDYIVAVKKLKARVGFGDRERLELMAEIEIMKSVNDHPNVIKLLHYCVDECGPILLIMEYAENGKLQTYLRGCRESRRTCASSGEYKTTPSITSKELLKFTYHIAKGMEYVASQGIVHRDLASRNILVSKDHVCKVADFGFARRVNDECAYERTTTNPVPVKWMAPEALVGNKFTSKSDVFSLGILMWEIVTLGATPYEQLTSEGVYKKVTTGGRLERPPHCKDEFFNLMAKCWLHDPVQRPSFKEVAQQLEELLLSENDYIELDQYPEHAYYNILNTAEKEVVNLET